MDIYDKIKDEISQSYYTVNFPNVGQRFVVWYLRNIHNLDTIEAKTCITDGAGDKQIDAVYIDNQTSTIYIIQGKFINGGTIDAEPLREVVSSWLLIQNLPELQKDANDRLKVKINEIATALEDDYEVCFELITTATLTEAALGDFQLFQDKISESSLLSANFVLVDCDLLQARYDESLNKIRPYINHQFTVDREKFMEMQIGTTKAVIAAIPLKECIKIPGIKDGTLFRKNVRQSLGSGNKVNKEIARTLHSNPEEFFFLHNGITAICSSIEIDGTTLSVKALNVVNGCQSLTTIYNCGESARRAEDAYVMFRFYEISDAARADKISTSTNTQSAVKARDLRSNDKYVLLMKKAYEERYTDGYFITKRGEQADIVKYNSAHVVELSSLGKQLISWHSQRPILAYSESRIFDKYFDQLFHREYSPEKIQALKELTESVQQYWTPENPLGFNEALLAMKSQLVYHHLYTISVLICEINKMQDLVADPSAVWACLQKYDLVATVIEMAGNYLNIAFELAVEEGNQNSSKAFSPQNWSKQKGSLKAIRNSVKTNLSSAKFVPGMKEILDQLNKGLLLQKTDFEPRWSAD